jgi:hypothetical protein
MFAPGIFATISREVMFSESGEITPLSLDLSLNLPPCSPSAGTPLLQQISLIDNGVLEKIEETPEEVIDRFSAIWYRKPTCHGVLLDLWVILGFRYNKGMSS